ncbi:hypothetical protein Golax_016465, partial [Gossypium laxum]|nr:hypothetical protein [Gossypium laxum]
DKFKKRIESWSTRVLSQGGKEVFINAVLQSIPTYSMACSLLPKSLCDELDRILCAHDAAVLRRILSMCFVTALYQWRLGNVESSVVGFGDSRQAETASYMKGKLCLVRRSRIRPQVMLKNLKGSKRKSLPEREILISGNPLMNLSLRLTLMGPMTPSMQDLGRGDVRRVSSAATRHSHGDRVCDNRRGLIDNNKESQLDSEDKSDI